MLERRRPLTGTSGLLLAVVLPFIAAPVAADSRCRPVSGQIVSELLTGPECGSPVGLCTRGRLLGAISGSFVFTATSLTPTPDTPLTGVVHYTGDMLLHSRRGDLFLKEAGGFNALPEGTGDVGAVSTITGGTGVYAGASGRLRITGTFTPEDGGDSRYQGQRCTE